MEDLFLTTAIRQFEQYKKLGEKTIAQLDEASLFISANEDSNSIATIVKHMWGNMLSRWTDFLTTDGEKDWRQRDAEFENDIKTRQEVLEKWEAGWQCLFDALSSLTVDDLGKTIFIRGEGQTVMQAILRQLTHYSYHIGQIVYCGKMQAKGKWSSLSIPKGGSQAYNAGRAKSL